MNGIEKASLGTRYLLDYFNTQKEKDLYVVKDCVKEIEFWSMVMLFCHNMDKLFEDMPAGVIEHIFTEKKVYKYHSSSKGSEAIKVELGKGYKSCVVGNYKDQLRLIRNSLAHGTFYLDQDMVICYNKQNGFKATFDIKWFKALITLYVSSNKNTVKSGFFDYQIVTLMNTDNLYGKDILKLQNSGLVHFLKVSCVAKDVDAVIKRIPTLEKYRDSLSFDHLKLSFIHILKEQIIKYSRKNSVDDAFKWALKDLKEDFAGILHIEEVRIDSSLLEDPAFLELNFNVAGDCLVNEYDAKDPVNFNSNRAKQLLKLLEKIKNDQELSLEDMYLAKDSESFLLMLYGYMISANKVTGYQAKKALEVLRDFDSQISFSYVHAKVVWKEYIKKISRGIDALVEARASFDKIDLWKDRLRIYKNRLERAINDDSANFLKSIRNSLTHGLVDIDSDTITFYGEEPEIKIPKIVKKTGELSETTFQNKSRTWEINIAKDDYIKLLDNLYTALGIEIRVNIAKYRKRKNYLQD